ncbi:MAG: SAM-dependent methyltransferase [Gammaproteobacteria bacterium]|nr:SAM-dependent methyltransferase [Gammaproteobacteria bacterium]
MENNFKDLRDYASINKVPIIKDGGFMVLEEEINKHNIKSVLEIGSAIGYSAIRLASLGLKVTTIERNKEMYDLCVSNVSKYNLSDMIEPIFIDALEYTPSKFYDLIFIDAAKAQNIKFFERFTPYLNDNGLVIVDNMDFHDLVNEDPKNLSKNLRGLVKKINEFKDYLIKREDYSTTFTHRGDGMSISIKK